MSTDTDTDDDPDALTLTVEGLRYRLDKAPRRQGRRVVVAVDQPEGSRPALVDRVDLYAFRSRRALAGLIADAFGRQASDVLGHLAVLLDQVERALAEPASEADADREPTGERRARALALLSEPDLLSRAAQTMSALGYVGEEQTKRLCYLVATSRLLRRPLSALLQAPSGCGKSELLEVTTRLLPAEAVEFLSRLTPQALFYAGGEALRHKLVVVDEQEGASGADYSLRTLLSKGSLTLRRPGSEGRETFTVHGPISLMSGTTSSALNEENLSRVLTLTLDDSPAQTRRVQATQRLRWAGKAPGQAIDLEVWRDAQRLLEPAQVWIPFAEQLSFPARTPHDRRGNQKLLGLVASHALLHQHQRRRYKGGRLIATPADYLAVHGLLRRQLACSVEDLSPRASRLYGRLAERPGAITRREAAALLGWGYNTAKRALLELAHQELVTVCDKGPPVRYRLLDASALGVSGGTLTPPEALPP